MNDSTRGEVRVTRIDHVAVVEWSRPPNNFFSAALLSELADALEQLDVDPQCRVTVLAAEGKCFCAGADLSAPEGSAHDALHASHGGNALYAQAVRLFAVRKPMVAAVEGPAIGGGLGLSLVSDFRIAGPDARFAANFVQLGLHPGFGLTHTLPRLIGQQAAAKMFFTGRRFKPDEALEIGLVDQLVPGGEVRAAALALAREIAAAAPLAVQSTRATLRDGLTEAVRAQTEREFAEQKKLKATADFAEGVRAVTERRPGRFTGR